MIQLWDLFAGYEKAHGRYEVKRVNEKGKNEGRAGTIREPATQAVWDAHIAGTGPGLGIIPLRSDNTVYWGCIDIDVIGIDHTELERTCRKLNLPLVICRSKSGGAHAFLFLAEPVDASIVISTLTTWAASLGQGGCEVFPKQSQRYDDVKDIGNWLNMPYYYADRTNRYCVHDGKELDLTEFLEFAESMRVTEDQLIASNKTVTYDGKDINNEGLFEEGPPCLQILYANGGFPDGTRNDGMFNVSVYLKKRFPDDWENKMQEYNIEMCSDPLPLSDITQMVNTGKRKEYEYRCRKPPISAHCNRRMCLGRKFGVGESYEGSSRPEILDVKKVVGDPNLWYMTINGVRMQFTTDEVTTQPIFQRKVFDHINIMPRTIPSDRWNRFLNELVQNCEIEYAPIDATPFGQFQILLEGYILGQSRTTNREQLATSNSPFIVGDGTAMFKLQGLLRYLDVNGFKYKSANHVAEMIKSDVVKGTSKQIHVRGKTFNVWVVPEPKLERENTPPVSFGTEEF